MRKAFLRALGVGGVAVGMTAYLASAQPAGKTLIPLDVGSPLVAGSTTVAAGKITVVGSGSDIWNSSDNFHYAYFKQTGDFDYVMKVESLTGCSGDGGWSKVELMARKEGTPGAGPVATDAHISNMTTRPSSDTPAIDPNNPDTVPAAGVNYRGPQWRAHDSTDGTLNPDGAAWDGVSSWTTPNPVITPNMPNNWVRLERVGSVFYMYWSDNGTTWTMYNPYYPQGWDTAGSWPAGTDNPDRAYFTNAWPSDIMVGIAVTAHTAVDGQTTTAVVTNFQAWTPVPIAITTQPPAAISLAANSKLSLDVAATGDPVHFQWRKDGTPIPRAVGTNYSVTLPQTTDSGTYTVRVFGGGTEIISTPCIVTITNDVTAPTAVEAVGSVSFTEATITFSEPVTAPTATTAGNYTIAGLAVTGAVLSTDGFRVTLTTAKQALGTDYTITVNNVQDTANNVIAAGTTVPFKSFSFLTGKALREQWPNAGSHNNLDTFIQYRIGYAAAPEDPIPPSTVVVEDGGFECPTTWAFGDNYGGRLSGWFIPPVNGNYIFYSCSDDSSYLFLSSDDKPANKRKISFEPAWNNSRSWKGTVRRDASDAGRDPGADGLFLNESDTWPNTEWGGANPGDVTGNGTITLVAGNRYYIEGLWQDGTGGDGFGATYRLSSEVETNVIIDNTATRITGALIGTYADTSKLPPTITTHPVDNVVLDQGGSVTLSVVANNPAAGALTYQWTHNGKDIPGATSADYTIANARVLDMGQYRCKVSNKNSTVTTGDGNPNPTIVMVKATGVFAIEGEDFDYGSGQSMPAASVMPYYGGAYEGLSAVRGVDYMNDDDPGNNQANGHPVYRYGGDLGVSPDDPNTGATCSVEQPGGLFATNRLGEWAMTNNYKLGWTGSGNWGNYTRTFPTPAKTYYVFFEGGYDGTADGQMNGSLGFVTAGVGTATQTVEPIGTFNAQGTGDWSRNNLIPLLDSNGDVKTVEIGGTKTLRWQYNSADAEALLFVPTTTTGAPVLTPTYGANGSIQLAFSGGTLYFSTTAQGGFAPVTPQPASPYTVDTKAGATGFYQVRQ